MSRPRNASGNHAWVELSDQDIARLVNRVVPDVDRVLKGIAGQVANAAVNTNAFKDSNKTQIYVRKMDFSPDKIKKHKHLRRTIRPSKSKFEYGGYIVLATAPHAHLVEYGHAMVTHEGDTIGHVPAHSFLRRAKNEVLSRLAPVLPWD